MPKPPLHLILASASPRRRQLLAEAGYDFSVVAPDIDESDFSTHRLEPRRYAERLALAKAKSVAAKFPKYLVLGADTTVDFEGAIIGKPADEKHAVQIIKKLFSAPHKVVTAVALVKLADGIELLESDSTTIYPKKLTKRQIAQHIKSLSWRGKAGAYAISEDAKDPFIEKTQGSLTNVMGLPMELLKNMLEKL